MLFVQLYATWADTKRYESKTRKQYQAAMVAPLKWFVPGLIRRDVLAYLELAGMNEEKMVRAGVSPLLSCWLVLCPVSVGACTFAVVLITADEEVEY